MYSGGPHRREFTLLICVGWNFFRVIFFGKPLDGELK